MNAGKTGIFATIRKFSTEDPREYQVDMTSTFEAYEIILRSNLFDPDFYINSYPDVAALGSDPLLHYIEYGAKELRNPSRAFDARDYFLRCRAEGHEPGNPLLDFIISSKSRSVAQVKATTSERLKLNIDIPTLTGGTADRAIRGNLEIAGWALARNGVHRIEIAVDGRLATTASLGVRRPDVQALFPDWPAALTAGYTALIPHRSLEAGARRISVTLTDTAGEITSVEFVADIVKAGEPDGPWSLNRREFGQAGKLWSRLIATSEWQPFFNIVLSLPASDTVAFDRALRTAASLSDQSYVRYRVFLRASNMKEGNRLAREIARYLPSIGPRLTVMGSDTPWPPQRARKEGNTDLYYMVLNAGDQLARHALLEFAAEAGEHRDADFIYSDDRRPNPATGRIEAFFKPDWSPDLLLSSNYLGRSWCAKRELLERSAITWKELGADAAYTRALQLSEVASEIRHLPAVLMECDQPETGQNVERKALEGALARRAIAGTVEDGAFAGLYRVRRAVNREDLVSIIIPTCATRGLIKTCIDTIRHNTAYRNFEIICVENIPDNQQRWKTWLAKNADTVISIGEPFNWSRFNNVGAAAASGRYLLFLNDDIEIEHPAWLEGLLEHAQRPNVGVVGAKLLYPDHRIQHAGIFLSSLGVGRHAFRYADENEPGYFGLAQSQRNVIAVTGACLMTRRDTFEMLEGFDETHSVVNNDLDYCLRAWKADLATIYTPYVTLIHHEQVSRIAIGDIYDANAFDIRWRSTFAEGDPFYNPNLSRERDDYSNEWEAVERTYLGAAEVDRECVRSILVLKLDHIGDCVLALPALRRLRSHFPAAKISVLSSRASHAVWQMEPAVDEVIEFDFFFARSSMGLIDLTEEQLADLELRLAPYAFDLAIDLRKHTETRPLLRRTGARVLCGFDHRGKYSWLDIALEWSEDIAGFRKRNHATDDLINLVNTVAAALEPRQRLIPDEDRLAICRSLNPRLFEKRVVCVHACAGNPIKQWPVTYFTALIDLLTERNDVHVAIIGSAEEKKQIDDIVSTVRQRGSVWSMGGTITLEELPGFLARCTLFVGNDSGPKHIAAGLGIPTIGIHSGIVDVREWGPVGPFAIGISRDVNCSPCYRSTAEDCHRQLACMTGISPAAVYRLCARMLKFAVQS